MRSRSLTVAVLCAAVATMAWANPPDAGGPNGKGPDGAGPPGHAGDAVVPAPPPAPSADPASPVLSAQGPSSPDQNTARDAVNAGEALPLADISARVEATLGGRVIDARLLRNGGTLVYQLTVLTGDGVSRRVYVDARTGQQIGGP